MLRSRLVGLLAAAVVTLTGATVPAAASPRTLLFSWRDAAGIFQASVYSAPSDGSQPPVLFPLAGSEPTWGARWSPDGTHLAFFRMDPSFPGWQLMTSAADGSNQHFVTEYDYGGGEISTPRWSPDGRWLYFIRDNPGLPPDPYNPGIFRVRPDGTRLKRVSKKGYFNDFALSPDGKRLVAQGEPGGVWGVYVQSLPRPGTPITIIPGVGPGPVTSLDWASADEITYSRYEGDGALHEIHPDGTGSHVLLAIPGSVLSEPAWSPDGTQLAYTAGPDRSTAQLFVANADGSHPVQITEAAGYYSWVAWQP
jgi:Tol biopolymer transport system component